MTDMCLANNLSEKQKILNFEFKQNENIFQTFLIAVIECVIKKFLISSHYAPININPVRGGGGGGECRQGAGI